MTTNNMTEDIIAEALAGISYAQVDDDDLQYITSKALFCNVPLADITIDLNLKERTIRRHLNEFCKERNIHYSQKHGRWLKDGQFITMETKIL